MDAELWDECPLCSARAAYTGISEWHADQLFGLFSCAWHAEYYAVWRPGFNAQLLDNVANASRELEEIARRLAFADARSPETIAASLAPLNGSRLLELADVHIQPSPDPIVALHLDRWSPRFSQMQAAFGAGEERPPSGADAARTWVWTICPAGAPAAVSIAAGFAAAPAAWARPRRIALEIGRGE
ncbi:MAG TPA: hypothetical protein VGC56_15860 [Allosphingosinicella sp.]|jgi:hypothetical protein